MSFLEQVCLYLYNFEKSIISSEYNNTFLSCELHIIRISLDNSLSKSKTLYVLSLSKADVGSSNNIIDFFIKSARAIEKRCFSPPLNVEG